MNEYDVIIIGGGATGVGTARDCALRGLRTALVERFDLTSGATGRNHGLLHSGARYAVSDPESAKECIEENRIIRKIAGHCVEPTDGLFISLPDDDPAWRKKFLKACSAAGIETGILDPKEALKLEPSLNPGITGAIKVPDASVDPFRLATANALDAAMHGASILTYKKVEGFIISSARVEGVRLVDTRTGEKSELRAPVVVIAAGIWSGSIASLAGVEIGMTPSKGSLLIFGHRIAKMTLNRCRKPSNADILVPGDVVSVLGTTSSTIPVEECDNLRVTAEEVDILLGEGVKIAPVLAETRIIRAYAGVRPLVYSGTDGRSASRGVVLIDHASRDGLAGLITVTGGKLTTYRKMAEEATDLVCRKLGVRRPCQTASKPLPGSEKGPSVDSMNEGDIYHKVARNRHGTRASKLDFSEKSQVLCECEHVTRAEIAYAVKYLDVHSLIDLRRRTRIGMGTCQGAFCTEKVAAALAEELGCPDRAQEFIREYLAERWKGMAPVCWGESLRGAEFMRKKYLKEDEI